MKVVPLFKALQQEKDWAETRLVHTGQHYDPNMSDVFFQDFRLPEPDLHLGVGSGSHAEQTAGVMLAYEKACLAERPHWVIVVGDVNATLACTLVAKKLEIQVAHLEAGLRSGDRSMPEELNRLVTDALADLLWTPSSDADENLLREGVTPERIRRVGNIMIDSLEMMRPRIEASAFSRGLGLGKGDFGVVTLHRPSNVDYADRLLAVVEALVHASKYAPLVFPLHPRTKLRLTEFGLLEKLAAAPRILLLDPLGYVDFMRMIFDARYVITDSGGIQEETTYLGIPCLTLRENTERPITLTEGTNRLVGPADLVETLDEIFGDRWPLGRKPNLWDGQTALRVVADLKRAISSQY